MDISLLRGISLYFKFSTLWVLRFFSIFAFIFLNSILVGCSSNSPMARVFVGFDTTFNRSYQKTPEFKKFISVYNLYAAKTRTLKQQIVHFSDAYNRVRDNYVEDVEDSKLLAVATEGIRKLKGRPGTISPQIVTEAALDELLTSLDPHSSYLNPEEYKESQIATTGEFGGLGIEINMHPKLKVIRVISPIADTPAARAGIMPGDLITHVNETSIKGVSMRDIVKKLRGPPGTSVRLTILRNQATVVKVSVVRAIIKIQPVKWYTEGKIGIIKVTHFISNSELALKSAIRELTAKLDYQLKGLVLDLRNNPGGLLNQSIAVADLFLEQGTVVSVRSKSASNRDFSASGEVFVEKIPMVVLVNQGSASASEIVAGALQDYKRAIVMGRKSYGKGSVQTITPLNWDGALRLTTALYYLPSGRTIQGRGITPDIELAPSKVSGDKKSEIDLPNSFKIKKGAISQPSRHTLKESSCPVGGPDGKDRMLGCAVLFLKSGSESDFLYLIGSR